MSRLLLAALVVLAGCVSPAVVPYLSAKGAYQTFSGTTSDGRRFTGASWFEFADDTGRMCASVSRKYSCQGTYDARDEARVLPSSFRCTGGVTGTARTERVEDRELGSLVAVRGRARLSDGTTARFEFGPTRPWNGEAICP